MYVIKLKSSSTHYGPYAERWMAQDAQERIARNGDSLDMKWPLRDLKITKVREKMESDSLGYLRWVDAKTGKYI